MISNRKPSSPESPSQKSSFSLETWSKMVVNSSMVENKTIWDHLQSHSMKVASIKYLLLLTWGRWAFQLLMAFFLQGSWWSHTSHRHLKCIISFLVSRTINLSKFTFLLHLPIVLHANKWMISYKKICCHFPFGPLG